LILIIQALVHIFTLIIMTVVVVIT